MPRVHPRDDEDDSESSPRPVKRTGRCCGGCGERMEYKSHRELTFCNEKTCCVAMCDVCVYEHWGRCTVHRIQCCMCTEPMSRDGGEDWVCAFGMECKNYYVLQQPWALCCQCSRRSANQEVTGIYRCGGCVLGDEAPLGNRDEDEDDFDLVYDDRADSVHSKDSGGGGGSDSGQGDKTVEVVCTSGAGGPGAYST
ncbi:MAG: hypothetical protein JKY23_06070 [Nitrospinaceae bacterium]|nr:hypothetical protein [Nitrospinaceae bacterium]